MRYFTKEAAAKHERILKEASRLFRERGFDNVTVIEVIKAAGLSQGVFYAHFDSKEELIREATAYDRELSANRARSHGASDKGRRAYADHHLSLRHRDDPGGDFSMAAAAKEVAHSSPDIRMAFERGLEAILSAPDSDRKEGIFRTAALLGALVLARAIQDPNLSNEILESVRNKLT